VLIYGIRISVGFEGYGTFSIAGQAILDELSIISGGRAYFPESRKQSDEVAEHLALQLRHQYVIGFTPTNAERGGKWNKVKIKVTPLNDSFKGAFVLSREGYVSPPASP